MNVNIWASFAGNDPVAVSARNLAWELHQAGVEVGLVPRRGDDTRSEDFHDYHDLFQRMLGSAVVPGAPAIFHGRLTEILQVADDSLPTAGAIASLPLQLTVPSSYAIISLASRYRQVWTPCVEVLVAVNQVYPGLAVLVPWVFPRAIYGQQEPSTVGTIKQPLLVSFDCAPATLSDLQTLSVEHKQNVAVASRYLGREARAKMYQGNNLVTVTQDDQYWAREGEGMLRGVLGLVGPVCLAATVTREPIGKMLADEIAQATGPREVQPKRSHVELGIVIPYYRRGAEYLNACIWSIDRDECLSNGYPVVVFGNGSTEQEMLIAKQGEADTVQLVSWNLCKARNVGFKHLVTSCSGWADGREWFTHVLFLDCDTILPSGALPALIRRLERDPNTVAVFNVLNLPRTVTAEELEHPEGLDARLAGEALYERTGVGCCAVPVKAFADVRGFDETYEGWGSEDNDLLIRLVHLGVKVTVAHDLPPLFHQFHERSPTADAEMKRNVEKLATSDPGRVVNPDGWGEADK